MGEFTSSEVVNALISDHDARSGWMTSEGRVIEPRSEIWLAGAQMWVRADGRRASGWRGNEYYASHFGWLARLRIRQVVRWWAKRQPIPAESNASGPSEASASALATDDLNTSSSTPTDARFSETAKAAEMKSEGGAS